MIYVPSYMYFYGVTLGFWGGRQIIAARGVIETIPSIFRSSFLKVDKTCVLALLPVKHLLFRVTLAFSFLGLVCSVSVLS
jgi:hypothetical protein